MCLHCGCESLASVQIMALLRFNSVTETLWKCPTHSLSFSLWLGSNSSLNTSLPSPGAWPYSASDNSFTNVHSTSGTQAVKLNWTMQFPLMYYFLVLVPLWIFGLSVVSEELRIWVGDQIVFLLMIEHSVAALKTTRIPCPSSHPDTKFLVMQIKE